MPQWSLRSAGATQLAVWAFLDPLADVFPYVYALLHWWLVAILGIDAGVALLQRFNVLKKRFEARHFIWLAMFLIVVAGYKSWKDEHEKLTAAEAARAAAATQIEAMRAQSAKDEEEIRNLSGRLTSRRLGDDEKSQLRDILDGAGENCTLIITTNGNWRSAEFARSVQELFLSAGWTSGEMGKAMGSDWPIGLTVTFDPSNTALGEFSTWLTDRGFYVRRHDEKYPDCRAFIQVGDAW